MGARVRGEFSIDVSWLPAGYGPLEVSATAASIEIKVCDKVATRIDDTWSKSVDNRTRISAYPLALWIASSWWRLQWETLPLKSTPDTRWKMAHEMPGAGHGYLWPRMRFVSDGAHVSITCTPSNPLSEEPIRYLAAFQDVVSVALFEETLDAFVSLVLSRLESIGAHQTLLHDVWREVTEERSSKKLRRGRLIEARLGFEPDEAPVEIIDRLEGLSAQSGEAAIDEIAPVCAGPNHAAILDEIESLAQSPGIGASPCHLNLPIVNVSMSPPWKIGQSLARASRKECGLNGKPVSDATLADILGIPGNTISDGMPYSGNHHLGLAVRQSEPGRLKLFFRKRNRPARRFEAARLFVDQLVTSETENWLPATDSDTSRQKMQRAFAAEFLCPIDSLRDYLGGNVSMQSLEEAADEFGVSDLAIKSILANHGDIPADWVNP
ncbi:MAG: hypothetical protein HYX27_04885 [Acidobacteria bacterium]|nr:hypothetical protein [Acidobacteriota bacterium]